MTGRALAQALLVFALVLAALPLPAQTPDCPDWVARTVSVQGRVETRRAGQVPWLPVKLDTAHCPGDAVRLGPLSRAALALRDGAILRLDQNTTITFTPPTERAATWIELLTGAVHFWSRTPRTLRINTPFVNGSVEGTEFLIEVDAVEARISVWEGRVLAENAQGSLTLVPGQSAVARTGQPPMLSPIVLRRPDAVTWTLYYPPVLDLRPEDFPDRPGETWPALVRRSIEEARRGDLAAALASATGIPDTVTEPRAFTHRAGLLLAVGRVDEARPDIDRALRLAPQSGDALALQAVVALAKNDEPAARLAATQATQLASGSAAAHLADSYVRQAAFDLNGALASAQQAVRLQPGNALAHARVAELWLSLGDLDRAQEAATEAVRIDPASARAQTVLGFAALTRIRRREATEAFERAISLDPAAPLPRLGLGLTRIRGGDLEGGRQELEIAVGLDPGDSLLRSYLGKAYYEERRPVLAADQFRLAKELDPSDPTPWFYDAIRLQSVNRPVEALQSLQRSIELNDNRAVYRSRLLLDEDRAARGASLARIYDDLGFQQRALLEGWRSLEADPTNHSAHRFLADSYSTLPRHDVARVSELLQSQLLQPLSTTPVPPQLALSKPFFLVGTGPANPSLNEFYRLFERNGISLWGSGLVASNDTYGDEVVLAGLWNRFAFSVGQFHYQSDGIRPNNDQQQDVYNVFAQVSLTVDTSLLAEFRTSRVDRGDLFLRFDPENFRSNQRETESLEHFRIGLRHAFSPSSTLIAHATYQTGDFDLSFGPDINSNIEDWSYTLEAQHLLRAGVFRLVSGLGYTDGEEEILDRIEADTFSSETSIHHFNAYVYSLINYPKTVTLTLGASVDLFRGFIDRNQFNPKFGLLWTPTVDTTVRAAVFRTLERTLVSSQTIEPTNVAGFNQFFTDGDATDAWRYGLGVDQRLLSTLYVGAEISSRELKVPVGTSASEAVREHKFTEALGRAYAYWTPHRWWALSAAYQYERLRRPASFVGEEEFTRVDTHRFPLSVGFFHPSGVSARVTGTYVYQDGEFGDPRNAPSLVGDDQFWVVDASISYRLPKRWGLVTLEARNLFDERFRFQDTDPRNPTISPERLILFRFTLAY